MSKKYPGNIITANAPAGYSVYLDGTGDYLNLGGQTAFAFGTGDWTIEFWLNFSSTSGTLFDTRPAGTSSTTGYGVLFLSAGAISYDTAAGVKITSSTLTANTWYHVALCKASGTTRLFINGTQSGSSYTDAVTYGCGANRPIIGADGNVPTSTLLTGYLANYRVVKGYALYATTFTPPTQLLNVTGTSLLTCNSPAIIDQSPNAFTVTANGDSKVSTFTPFTAYVPYNPALGASTPGVWSLNDAIQAAATRQWNMYDPYYNLTTLSLHGNYTGSVNSSGTAVYQNNTFLDSSSNNFTITRNGSATQGSFTPFSQQPGYWSTYADTAYQGFSGGAALIGSTTNTFTAEAWVYMTAAPASGDGVPCLIGMDASPSSSIYLGFGPNASRQLVLRWFDGASKTATGGTTLALNTWYHIAVVSNANALAMYVNGVAETLTGTTTLTNRNSTTSSFSLLQNSSASAYQFKGYASNIRVTNTAVYTSGFTPSTTPLTAVTGTQLLTLQSNRFVDNSSNAYALTVISTPSVQAFAPFYNPTAYTPALNGGSGYFDGASYLVNSSLPTSITLGASDFCIEAWAYWTSFNFGTYGAPIITLGGTSSEWMLRANKTSASTTSANYYFVNNGTFIPSAGFSSGVSALSSEEIRIPE